VTTDAHALLAAWHAHAAALLPSGVAVWDAHCHTGSNDPDGFTNTAEATISALDDAGHERAVVMTSADPAGYPAQNDRILDEAAAARGRLIPFARIDPTRDGAVEEAERCLDAGHSGLKLHPRSERFDLGHPVVADVVGLAAERAVPVLVHAGRGMDPLGDRPVRLLDANPGLTLVLAHCAISDLGTLAPQARSHPGLLFDTAWWNPTDIAALLAWVDVSQVLYASDMPYGSPFMSSTITARVAVSVGLESGALAALFGGNLRRALDGVTAAGLGVARPLEIDPMLLRVASNLFGAVDSSFAGVLHAQPIELALAAATTADHVHAGLLDALRTTLEVARGLDERDRRVRLRLLIVALAAALTPAAGHPEL
jgi:predicted TIM-barrel fold metal-dependent hydrolase